MKYQKQIEIILTKVRQRANWETSFIRSYTHRNDFLAWLKLGQDRQYNEHGIFVTQLDEAGKIATEPPLWHLKRYADSGGATIAATEFFGGHHGNA